LGNHWLLYGSVSRGWLPGGFNLLAVSPDIDQDLVQYDSEKLWSYELGIKGKSADERLRMSAALFWIDATDWQEITIATRPDGTAASTTVVTNDGDVRSRGVEAELAWLATDTLDLAIAGAYTDSEYRNYVFGSGVDYSGNRPAFTPEYEVKARAQWKVSETLTARASVAVQGDTALNASNTAVQETFALFDASLTYTQGAYSVTVFAQNLTNTYYFAGGAFDNFVFGLDGVGYAPVGAPRAIGLEFSARW